MIRNLFCCSIISFHTSFVNESDSFFIVSEIDNELLVVSVSGLNCLSVIITVNC